MIFSVLFKKTRGCAIMIVGGFMGLLDIKNLTFKYNDKEITIPCVMKKTDTIDKPVLFSESGSNFIFIAVSRHLGTGLYKTDALIFNADTLQNVPLKKILTLSGIISLLKFLIQLKQFLSLQPIKQSFCKINPA